MMEIVAPAAELLASLRDAYFGLAPVVAPWALTVAVAIIAVMGVQNALYTLQLVLAGIALAKRSVLTTPDSLEWLYGDVILPVSLIVPMYNEEDTVIDSVRSLLALRYPLYEVIVVNDGSRDGTLAELKRAFDLYPIEQAHDVQLAHKPIRGLYRSPHDDKLLVIDKENGGKADALNAGIEMSRMPLFASLDGDSLLQPDSLIRVVYPFVEDPDRVIAVAGTVRVVNDCVVRDGRVLHVDLPRSLLARFQVIEYLRAFLMGRLGWSQLGALTQVSGAFGVFHREAVIKVGGYSSRTVGEDYELVMRLHRHYRRTGQDYDIVFVPEPVCWTQVPESFRHLAAQRIRWQRGALETFFTHLPMLFNPRYGRIGFVGMGHNLIVDLLGPVAEALGYLLLPFFWSLGVLDLEWLLAFLALIFVYGVFLSAGSLALEEAELKRFPRLTHLLKLTAVAVIENFGYRQINNIWRIVGTWQYLRGKRGQWGHTVRKAFSAPVRSRLGRRP